MTPGVNLLRATTQGKFGALGRQPRECSTASTLFNEQGWPADAIERQLSHGERDEVRGAYNFAEYLPLRRKMMQAWADYLEALECNATTIRSRFR